MAIFGWCVLVVMALFLSVVSAVVGVGCLRLTGKFPFEVLPFLALGAIAWWFVVTLKPFALIAI